MPILIKLMFRCLSLLVTVSLFSNYLYAATAIECSTADNGKAVINEIFTSATAGTQQFVELKSLIEGVSDSWKFCYSDTSSAEVCKNIPNQNFIKDSYFVLNFANKDKVNQTQGELLLFDGSGTVIDGLLYCNDTSCTETDGDATLYNWSAVSSCTTTLENHDSSDKDIARIPDGTGNLEDNGSDHTKGEDNDGNGGGGGNTIASGFNCMEDSSTDAINGHIHTRLVSKDFILNIAALKDSNGDNVDDAVETNFADSGDITVLVELVDANSDTSCASMAIIDVSSQNLIFTASENGRINSSSFNSSKAYRNVRCRITDASNSVTSCSSDAFSIRPQTITVDTSSIIYDSAVDATKLKAGNDVFILSISSAPNNGTLPKLNSSLYTAHDGLTAGYITEESFSTNPVLGVAEGTFTYSEVGLLRLEQYAIYNDSFADIDKNNGDCIADDFSRPSSGKVGCNFGNEVAVPSSSGFLGRFIPDHFDITLNTPEFEPACGTSFTYVGEPIKYVTIPIASITAKNAYLETTKKYTGDYWKIDTSSITPSYTEASHTLSVLNANSPVATDIGDGTGTLSFADTLFNVLAVDKANPEAPFDAEIALEFSLVDTDSVTVANVNSIAQTNPVSFGSVSSGDGIAFTGNEKKHYWGRLTLNNTHGSEQISLAVPSYTEYFNGTNFTTNISDSCTLLNISQLTFNGGISPVTVGSGTSTASIANSPLLQGQANLSLSAPGSGNTGFVDIRSNTFITSNSWLAYDWDGNGIYDNSPSAKATFGIYKGSGKIIYFREVY